MTPEDRKLRSEAILAKYSVRVNPALPLIEPEADTKIRTAEQLLQRLVALWSVAGTALLPGNGFFRAYLEENELLGWLSASERSFILAERPTEREVIHASWQLEGLYFLGWCGGLVDQLEVPTKQSSVEPFMHLFPQDGEDLSRLKNSLSLRSVSEILDWSDLLYRLHWAVRDAQALGTPPPSNIEGGVV
jgi:hypothetical protein